MDSNVSFLNSSIVKTLFLKPLQQWTNEGKRLRCICGGATPLRYPPQEMLKKMPLTKGYVFQLAKNNVDQSHFRGVVLVLQFVK